MKLWERVIEGRLRTNIRILENQFGFMPSRSTTEPIHLIGKLIEFYRDRKRDLHVAFIDLEKAYDKVAREVLWRCLDRKSMPVAYLRVVKDMYSRVWARVRTLVGDMEDFPIDIELLQGLALSPFLFTIVIDELTRRIQDDIT